MTLPKIDQPTYELKLPYSKITINFRPFVVKEEKILLLAAQGKDEKEITRSIKQVVGNCIILPPNKKLDDFPSFEIDYIFLNMRGKSIGDKVEQEFTCNNEKDGIKCGHVFIAPLSISDVNITEGPKENKIMLTPSFGVMMKFPSFKTYDIEDPNSGYYVLIDCIDYVFDAQQKYSFKDKTSEECIDWLESLTKEQFSKLEDWYNKMPHIQVEKSIVCSKCGFEHKLRLEDPLSFF